MNRHLPPFSSIRAFEAAARHLSFKDAAQELHVSDSAISHQIRNLEDFLHAPLFIRKPQGVALTRRGEEYLSKLTAVLNQLDASTQQARGSGMSGLLKVQTTPAFAARWLVPKIRAFNQQYPDIELHITTSLAPPSFSGGDIDVVVQYGVEAASGLTVEPFLYSARSPVASPELLRQGMPLREPADLRHYTLLRDMVTDDWPAWFERASATPMTVLSGPRFEHCNLTLGAAEQGQGVALAVLALAESGLNTGTLVRLFDAQTLPKVIYSVVFPTEWKSYGKVAAFRGWLLDQVDGPAAGAPATGYSKDATAHH